MALVWVAMSGGVDSSVAAALLLEQGHRVVGVTMQLWPSGDEEGGCCSVAAVRDARRVCDTLGIDHYTLNYRELFERKVVEEFAHAYERGRTPNPCIACNAELKFSDLLAKALTAGADALATGHYARIVTVGGAPRLVRGADGDKDQSYFLYRMTAPQRERVMFPVGELRKSDVRAFASRLGLPVAAKAESQDACFEVEGSYLGVIEKHARSAQVPGEIVDARGRVLGRHGGIAHYTVGQRKGLGIGGLSEPLYVTGIDAAANRVIVGKRHELAVVRVEADDLVWHDSGEPRDVALEATVRYRGEARPCRVTVASGLITARFDEPLFGVAPGQALVCYRDDVVVGGGVITCAN